MTRYLSHYLSNDYAFLISFPFNFLFPIFVLLELDSTIKIKNEYNLNRMVLLVAEILRFKIRFQPL